MVCSSHVLPCNPEFREIRLLDDVTASLFNGDSIMFTNKKNNKTCIPDVICHTLLSSPTGGQAQEGKEGDLLEDV